MTAAVVRQTQWLSIAPARCAETSHEAENGRRYYEVAQLAQYGDSQTCALYRTVQHSKKRVDLRVGQNTGEPI